MTVAVKDTHWHIGTTCCGKVGNDCPHEMQYEIDMDGKEDLPDICSTQFRLKNGMMRLESYKCEGE